MRPYYADDWVELYHADARDVLPSLYHTDLIFTDPPYTRDHRVGRTSKRRVRPIAGEQDADKLVSWLVDQARRVLPPGGGCLICAPGNMQAYRWAEIVRRHMVLQIVVWDRMRPGMGRVYRRQYEHILVGWRPGAPRVWYGGMEVSNVVRVPAPIPTRYDHPTPKPVELVAKFLAWHTRPGGVVLDPFAGAGSTLLAAKRLGRRAIGIEVDERWCDLAAKSLAQETVLGSLLPRVEQVTLGLIGGDTV